MKKIYMFMASAALMFAVSCNKEEINVDTPVPVETELITVDLNPMTKTALGADGATTWDADDEVSVTVGGEVVGTLSLVEGSTFSGEITAGLSGEAVLNYPAGVTTVPATQTAVAGSFADEAALLEGTTTVEDLRAGTGVELKNKTALLMFTVAQAGDVTFEVGTAKYTVTGCKTGSTYYACVTPVENVAFVARIGGYLSKQASKNVTFTASKIANLQELPAPVSSEWELYVSDVSGVKFYNDLNNNLVAKNVSLKSTSKFKFHKENDWVRTIATSPSVGNWHKVYKGNDDLSGVTAATYDIYINTVNDVVCLVKAGDAIPAYDNTHKQYHILIEGNDWTGLYTWAPSELYGSFDNCLSNRTGTVTIKKDGNNDQQFSYWVIKTTETGKVFNFLFRKNGAQSGDITNVTLNGDIPCYSNNGYNGTYSLTTYDIK